LHSGDYMRGKGKLVGHLVGQSNSR
jgi:hypothetical protein